ncbi:MAG: acyl carrier protein [Clostridium sp.]|nr:acyl carrier protein [Clostridium sp.]
MMTIEEKIAMLEDVMDLDEGELKLDSVLAEFEEWDSLSKLSLIAMAKQDFGLVLTTDVIRTFNTVKDICDYLK